VLKFGEEEDEYLVSKLVTNHDNHGTVSSFDAILDQSPDAFVHLLPHFAAAQTQQSLRERVGGRRGFWVLRSCAALRAVPRKEKERRQKMRAGHSLAACGTQAGSLPQAGLRKFFFFWATFFLRRKIGAGCN